MELFPHHYSMLREFTISQRYIGVIFLHPSNKEGGGEPYLLAPHLEKHIHRY